MKTCYRCYRDDLKPEDFSPGNNRCRKCHKEYQAERRAKIAAERQAIDLTGTKVCSTCTLEKPKTEFGVANGIKDGLQTQCNGCRELSRKRYNTSQKGHVQNMKDSAKRRSVAKGRDFHMTQEMLDSLWERQAGKCAVTGIPLVVENDTASHDNCRNPFGPSVDRIDTTRGYELDNIRLTTTIANLALGNWGEEPLRKFAEATLKKNGYTVIAPSTPTQVN